MSKFFVLCALALALCALPQLARAQESGSAQTVPPGVVQIEGGLGFSRAARERETSYGGLQTRIGLDPLTELRIGLPAYVQLHGSANGSGFDDFSLSIKRTLLGNRGAQLAPVAGDEPTQDPTSQNDAAQQAARDAARRSANRRGRTARAGAAGAQQNALPGPALGIVVGTNLPIGARDIGADRFEPRVVLAFEDTLSERVSLASNLGYTSVAGQRARSGQYFGSLALGYSVNDQLGYFTEIFGTRNTGARSASDAFFNFGAVYIVNDKFELDLGIAPSLTSNPTRNYQLGLGFAKRF